LQRGEIALDFLKYFNNQVAVLPGNAGKRFSVRHVHQPPDLIDERFAPDLEIDTVRAAIRRISTSLQASKGFQTVKASHETHLLKIHQLCQPYLAYSFVIG